MRIGMLLDNEFTGDLRVENEIIALQKNGHQVYLLCFDYGGQKAEEDFYGAKIFRIQISLKLKKKLAGLNNTVLNFYPYFWSYYAKRFIAQNKIQALHVHDLWMLEGALKANKKFKLPLIADLHENFVQALSHYKYSNEFPGKFLISRKRWAKKEKEWLTEVDAIVTVIEEAVERYEKLGVPEKKIFVVPNYVNIEKFHIGESDGELIKKYENVFTLVYVGGFDTHRGLDTVIKGAAVLKDKIKNFKVILVGSGSNLENLKALAQRLGVEKIVSFEGWQAPGRLPSYINVADAGLIPHLKTIHTDNTIPHKLFQYMLFAKPVLASDCNPLVRILNETGAGLIFKANDEKDFAEKVIELYESSDLRKEMGAKGRESVLSKYNWEKASEELLMLYDYINNKE